MKYPRIAELLIKEREQGKSVREVCKKAGIKIASFYNYTSGDTTPDLFTLETMAENFGVTIPYLLGRDGDELIPPKNLSPEKQLWWNEIIKMSDDEAIEELHLRRKRKRTQE